MNNESNISLFYFEISDYPDVINILSVLPTERTEGWSWPDPVNGGDGSMQFTGYAIGSSMGPGDGAVCRVLFIQMLKKRSMSTYHLPLPLKFRTQTS